MLSPVNADEGSVDKLPENAWKNRQQDEEGRDGRGHRCIVVCAAGFVSQAIKVGLAKSSAPVSSVIQGLQLLTAFDLRRGG